MAASRTPRPTPVFVLGLQHSGTTWLASILAQHSRAAAVLSDEHGIHESILFSHFAPAYGDLDDDTNFERFAADFTSSDYYALSGVEPSWFWDVRPKSYPQALRALMEEVALRRGGADLWIEKSPDHTLLAEELAEAFPDARFVGITRQPQGAISSRMWAGGRQPPAFPARLSELLSLSAWRIGERWLRRFCAKRESCLLVEYERLVSDAVAESRRICEFLGVAYEAAMVEPTFRANTSFKSTDRRRALDARDKAVLAVAGAGLRLVPLGAWRAMLSRRRARVIAREGVTFPEWCWRRRDAHRLIFGAVNVLAEDVELREAAGQGDLGRFSTLCDQKFATVALDARNEGREFFANAFEDPEVRSGLSESVAKFLYERLRREEPA